MAKEKKEDKPADETLHAEETEAKPEQTTFEAKVNKYAFIHLSQKLRKAWGITKGTEQAVTIKLVEGNLVIRKA